MLRARLAPQPLVQGAAVVLRPHARAFGATAVRRDEEKTEDPRKAPREVDEVDVAIVGGGPAGIAAAIRLRQLAKEKGKEDLRVCVYEKGPDIGAQVLSGACVEPRALNELLPKWKEMNSPLTVPATDDSFVFLTSETGSFPFINPPQMNNHGNYVVSLGRMTNWMGNVASELGAELYPGFAAAEILYNEDGSVKGIATGDAGIDKNGKPKASFQRGTEIHAKFTLFAEGCRGHLTRRLREKFELEKGVVPQTYAIGLKELWEVDPKKHKPGKIVHTVGWPVPSDVYGGSFMYHQEDNKVAVGFVCALDYTNPYFNPYKVFQQWKTHPTVRATLEGGTCIAYGARALNEGGLQSIPKLTFPGGALIGATAGFMNVPKIKGSHTAMKSAMLAAEDVFATITATDAKGPHTLKNYEKNLQNSWVYEELKKVRNIRPGFQYGLWAGLVNAGFETVTFGMAPWTLKMKHKDNESLKKKTEAKPIEYPKPDGKLTFDILDNVARTGTKHEEDQPKHLTLKDPSVPVNVNLKLYDGPEGRFCPAKVYEFVDDAANPGQQRLQINHANCIHCKTCDIKDPTQNIVWVTPQGGEGPVYASM